MRPTSQNNVSTSHRRGTAAVEFALCIPVLLLIALAAADFGRIAHFHQIVCNAARTGAESGATHKFTAMTRGDWENSIHESVLAEMQNIPEFNSGEMGYELTTTQDADDLAHITVTVTYPFRTKITWPGVPAEVVLQKSVAFRQFR